MKCQIILLGSLGNDLLILDIRISDIDLADIGMEVDVDIGTIPISEWKDLVWHFLFRYQNKRYQCRMSDIADIKADVDAHLWLIPHGFNCNSAISMFRW